jgi:AraC-like DNA-binding protein
VVRNKTHPPNRRISRSDLESLIATLDVRFVALSECLVSAGYQLVIGGNSAPGIHYNLVGTGRISIGNEPAIQLHPHTLIIVPPNCPFTIEVDEANDRRATHVSVSGSTVMELKEGVRRYVAGQGVPQIILICGFFHASYGSCVDLFAALASPIVEQFDASDHLDAHLKAAMTELVAQEVGFNAMSAALLKQIIVTVLRRSLTSLNLWVERFSLLGDRAIAKALSEMAANPGAPHSLKSLAARACMSRTAFISRFVELIGKTPMVALRGLRMQQAARQLHFKDLTVEQIGREAGYKSSMGFSRAFRKTFGHDPSVYRNDRQATESPDSATKSP